jgi:TBC domain-containing protein kinase-like protein
LLKSLDPVLHESAKLPLAIKENDVEYQFHRTILFSRLLEGYPHSRERIISEATIDICPLLRGEIWAAILGVKVSWYAL